MSSGSIKYSNVSPSVSASSSFFAPRSFYRHQANHFRSTSSSSSYVPSGLRAVHAASFNESSHGFVRSAPNYHSSRNTYHSGVNKSTYSNCDRLKISNSNGSTASTITSSGPNTSNIVSTTSTNSQTKVMDVPSSLSSTVTPAEFKAPVTTSVVKAVSSTAATPSVDNKMVNGDTVRSLANNLESSLSLSSTNSSGTSTSNGGATNAATSVYNGCQGCTTDTTSTENATNNNSISGSETSLSISHGNSCSDSSKSLNAPKFGTPVPNRVFVGGIPLDVSELYFIYLILIIFKNLFKSGNRVRCTTLICSIRKH